MNSPYNRIAGQNLDRLAALSDGIFAVAMTLLVINLHVPVSTVRAPIHNDLDLLKAIGALAPSLLPYLMSFLTLGIFWVGQQTQLNHFARSDRNLTWIHLGFLLGVTLLPFSTALLAAFITYRVALAVYWFNLLLLGVMLFASMRYAWGAKLVGDAVTPEVRSANERRIIVYQALYAFSALLCIINTYVSIACLILLQLNAALAPRIRPFDRL